MEVLTDITQRPHKEKRRRLCSRLVFTCVNHRQLIRMIQRKTRAQAVSKNAARLLQFANCSEVQFCDFQVQKVPHLRTCEFTFFR